MVRRLLKDELARGTMVNMAFIGAQAAITLVSSLIAARYLGPEGIGIVAIGLLLAEFVSVFDNLASQGFIRDHAADPQPSKIATILGTKALLGVVATVGLLAISPLVSRAFNVPVVIPLSFAFIPVASIASSVALMSWEAQRDMKRRNLTTLAEAIARLGIFSLIAFIVVLPFSREAAIAFGTLTGSCIASVVGAATAPSLSLKGFDRKKAIEYMRFGLKSQSAGALYKVIFWFDIILIDLYFGHYVQGLYKTAYVLMSNIVMATSAVSIMMYPTIAKAVAARDNEKARHTFSLGAFYAFIVATPFVVAFLLFPEWLLRTLTGPEYLEAAWILRAFGGVGILIALLVPFEVYFPAIGRPDLALRVALVQVTVNVGLNLILVPQIKVAGAVIATAACFGAGLVTSVIIMRKLRHELPRFTDLAALFRAPALRSPEEPPL
jgi:O-antigen/teichoic acid export membrane protein